jgi:hypothetical protein
MLFFFLLIYIYIYIYIYIVFLDPSQPTIEKKEGATTEKRHQFTAAGSRKPWALNPDSSNFLAVLHGWMPS